MFNPYFNNSIFPYTSNSPSSVEIPHVNGQNGAMAYQLPSNSSILLLDDNAPIVYLVKTDSACYKTVKPYSITEYKPEPAIDLKSLLNRVEDIERRLNESNSKSTQSTEQSSQYTSRTSQILDGCNTSFKQSNGSNTGASGN